MLLRWLLTILLATGCCTAGAQTLGGEAAFPFLKLPATPLLSATGGANVSWRSADGGHALYQPALLSPELDGDLGLYFNSFVAGVKSGAASYVHHREKEHLTFGAGLFFMDYGSIAETDAAGNRLGTFRPQDFTVQLSASYAYLQRWRFGASLRYIGSRYGQYTASGIAIDAGLHYRDSARQFSAGVLVRNAGTQLRSFTGEKEELPFDLQAGITKKLARAPLGFSLTAQGLHRFNLAYADTAFNNENEPGRRSPGFAGKLLQHVIAATHLYLGPHLEATIGYNHLRRSELNIGTGGNGLNGFSSGLRTRFRKLELHYTRAWYGRSFAYNQMGVVVRLKEGL
ncbi:MAG TPA: type IX secretion system protein PorQ [Chitinophagaceae bacterium]|jgi:hypothetical protein|nr:type IX secretion system protein PorQ [Chitinophagaceae bacterium]